MSSYRWTPPEIITTEAEIPPPVQAVYAETLRSLPTNGKALVLRYPDRVALEHGQNIIGTIAVNKFNLRVCTRRHEQPDGSYHLIVWRRRPEDARHGAFGARLAPDLVGESTP